MTFILRILLDFIALVTPKINYPYIVILNYHSINNIKGFLAIEYFCPCCLNGFHNKKSFDAHVCNDCDDGVFSTKQKKQVKSSKIGKDLSHYMNSQEMKGGKAEVE